MAFSESLLNSEPIKSAYVYSLPFLGDCEGFISMTLIQFFISQGMQLNIILNSFSIKSQNIAVLKFSYNFIKPFSK